MADAFISYSRKDKTFASALKTELEADGFEILFDLEDILGSEDWARRLVDMIAAVDHVVFVISPDSCQSRVCSVEITTALELSKSIVPVALRQTAAEIVPVPIAQRQWIDCQGDTDPNRCAKALGALFKTSPAWLRQHTDLTTRARDWHLARRRSALLRGSDLRRAEAWLADAEGREPPPSALQAEYIATSRKWRRTSRVMGAVLLAVATSAAAIGLVVIDDRQKLSADSRLVSVAGDWMERDPTRSALVMLEVKRPERTPYATATLMQLVTRPIASCELNGHTGGVTAIEFSPTGTQFLTLSGNGTVRLWSATECHARPLREMTIPKDAIERAFFSSDGKAVVLFAIRGGARLWHTDTNALDEPLPIDLEAAWLTRSGDVLVLRNDFTVELWGTTPGLVRKNTLTPFAHLPGYGAIERALFSPASDRVLLRTHGGAVAIWTIGDSHDATLLPGGDLLAISPDGSSYARSVLAEQRGREYRRWYDVLVRPTAAAGESQDGAAGEDLREAEHDEPLDAAAFSSDGRYVITASGAGALRLSDLREPAERKVARLTGHTAKVRGVQIAPSGNRFVTFGDDRVARVWAAGSLSTEMVCRGHVANIQTAAFSPDGRILVTGSEDGAARVWPIDHPSEPMMLGARGSVVTDAWFTGDDRFVVARSNTPDEHFEARPISGSAAFDVAPAGFELTTFALHPRESSIALASTDGDIGIRRLGADASLRRVGSHPGVNVMAFDANGRHIVSASRDGRILVWNIESGGDPIRLELPPDRDVEELSKKLEKDPRNETLQLAAIEMGLLKQNRGTFTGLAMVDSTNRVMAADATSVFTWPAGGGAGTRLNPGDKLIEAAAFDPDGKYIATAHAWDYTVRLWHADGSGLARTLGAATASTETLRFSPDGKHLVVASKDETVQIWHMDTNTPAVLLRGHTSWVVDAQFSKDSTHLVTTSYDGTSRVWNVDGSNEEIILNRSVYAARFDSTGSRIVTTSGNQVGVWSLDPARLQRALADRTRVCLDQSFRTRFLSENEKTAAAGSAACRQQRQPE